MLTDLELIIIVVVSPLVFFALLLAIGFTYRRRVRQALQHERSLEKIEEEATVLPCDSCHPPSANALGLHGVDSGPSDRRPSVGLPHFEDKTISIRRMSAFPHMDEIKRVNSIASTLTDITAEQQERDRRGSATTLIVTDMGKGLVGVERRPSVPEVFDSEMSSTYGRGSTSKDPGSPQDKRFSRQLSHIPPPDSRSIPQVDPSDTTETLKTPMTAHASSIPVRSPTKKKDRPDSIELAIARSPTLATSHPPLPATDKDQSQISERELEPPHTEPGELFKGWTGFSPSPQLNIAHGLAVTTDDSVEVTPSPRRSSLSAKRVSKITYLADVVKEEQAKKEADREADTEEVVVSPSKVALPQSPSQCT